jgi:hypothetical protein
MARLLACPFCRQLFATGEAKQCPECGVDLQPMEDLPPSLDALAEHLERGEVTPPEHRRLALTYWGRGRGPLLLLALLGLACFFAPWVVLERPEAVTLSGFDLARGRAGWLWGGAVGWFVMIPLVASRRTIADMRGVRVITALFSSLTLAEAAMLILLPPSGSRHVGVDLSWGWGLYAGALVSALGVFFGARFGGRLDDIEALPWVGRDRELRAEASHGHDLH